MEENEIKSNKSNNLEENNNSDNDIEQNNKFYQDFQNDEENYYENKKKKEEQRQKNEIRSFYYSIMELYTKKQYKKILELFSMKEEENEKQEGQENKKIKFSYQSEWIFSYLHLMSLEKVILNKFSSNKKSIYKIISFKKYFDKQNIILNNWLQLINELIINHKKNKEGIQCFLEFTIEFILSKCVYLSKYCINQENIKEAIYFLSLGIYLINNTYIFIRSPRILCICAELVIYLTSILIVHNKYDSAKNMVSFSIKLLYMGLEIILTLNSEQLSYSIFDILSQKKQNISSIIHIIFLISISFYHLGVSYENQENYYSAFFAYKQSKFFTSIIKEIDEKFYNFYEFISNVETRLLMRNRLILFYKKCDKKELIIEEEKPKVKVYNAFLINKEKRKKKFLNLEEYISNMNLVDVDKEDPHLFDKVDKVFKPNVNMATKQIHLLDYLLSDDFRSVIHNMKKIKINKLDYETIHIIRRQIINIKNNKREKLSKKIKKNKNCKSAKNLKSLVGKINITVPSSKTFNSGKRTRVSSGYKNSLTLYTDFNRSESNFYLNSRPSTAHNDRIRIDKNIKSKYISKNYLTKRSLTINNIKNRLNMDTEIKKSDSQFLTFSFKKKGNKKNKIPKYSYDKYLFNKSFMKKKKDLDKQYVNELNFQKKFLKCKEKEKEKPSAFNLKKVQTECEKFYVTTFDKEMMKIREKKFFLGNDYIKNIVRKKYSDFNANSTITNFTKSKKIKLIKHNEENIDKDIKENNYRYINDLMRDIDNINTKEKLIIKTFKKSKFEESKL